MRNRLKPGIVCGTGVAVFFIIRNLFIHGLDPSQLVKTTIAALAAGLVSGLIFGWLTGTSFFSKTGKQKSNA